MRERERQEGMEAQQALLLFEERERVQSQCGFRFPTPRLVSVLPPLFGRRVCVFSAVEKEREMEKEKEREKGMQEKSFVVRLRSKKTPCLFVH